MLSSYSVFCSLLSTVFLLLCSGFVEVLLVVAVPLVAAKRTDRGKRRILLRFFSVFSSSSSYLLLCFVHSPLSFSLSFFFLFPSPLFPYLNIFFLLSSCLPLCLLFSFLFFYLTSFLLCFSPRYIIPLLPLCLLFLFFWCGSSSIFIARRRRRFLVTASVHHSGVKHAPQTKMMLFSNSKWIFFIWS